MTTKTYRVYGIDGHRQRYAFCESGKYDWSEGDDTRIIELKNADVTGTHEYTEISITRNTAKECNDELIGQISDGFFENCRVGKIVEVWKWTQWKSDGSIYIAFK